MVVYFNGDFVDKEDVAISPDDRGFLFGDGVYEVVRAEDGKLFRLDDHRRRLSRSLKAIRLRESVDTDRLWTAVRDLLPRNGLRDGHAKVYLQITRGAAPRDHAFPDPPVEPTVYATASAIDLPTEAWKEGVTVILRPDQRWARCDVKSLNYLPNVLNNQAAVEADAYEALQVREGFVTEGTHSSVAAVFDGTVVTRPLTNHVLPSVTRTVLLELCADHSVPVTERPIGVSELSEADEILLLGTTTGLMPVVKIEDRPVADGTPGPVTRELQAAFRALSPTS